MQHSNIFILPYKEICMLDKFWLCIRQSVVSNGQGSRINVHAFKKCDYRESLHITTRSVITPTETSLTGLIFIY